MTAPCRDLMEPGDWTPEARTGWLGLDWPHEHLREAVLANPRLRQKLVALVAGLTEISLEDPLDPTLARLVEGWNTALVERIGLCWAAPALAEMLSDRTRRGAVADVAREDLRIALRYRHHADPVLITVSEDETDWHEEGLICIAAWADGLPDAQARLLRLRLPSALFETAEVRAARTSLVAQLLEDDAVLPRAGANA